MKEMTGLFCCLVFICLLDGARMCHSEELCHRQQFYQMDGFSLNGMLLVRKGPWPWKMCRRLCRQYFECTWFSVEWRSEKNAMCNIYNGMMNRSALVPAKDITLFTRCPLDFSWDTPARTCYSTTIYNPATWTDAVAICQGLHPGAKLAEPRNKIQNERLAALVGGQVYIWLGLYRPSDSSDLNEILYSSDESLASYYTWAKDQPNDADGVEDCIAGSDLVAMPWYDRRCLNQYNFICQF